LLLVLVLFFSLLLELRYQLVTHFIDSPSRILLLGAFSFLYWAGVWALLRTARESQPYRISMLALYAFGAYWYTAVLFGASFDVRDSGLRGGDLMSNGFMAHYVIPLVLGWGGFELYKQFMLRNVLRSTKGNYLIWGLALLTTLIASIELRHFTVMVGYGNHRSLDDDVAIKGTLPIAWTLLAMSMMSYGMNWKLKALRLASLALFSLTIAKLFLFDLGNSAARIVSLILLGAILLFVSFRYQKLQFILADDVETDEEEVPSGQD
jgi:uncharacterized membrane protein